MKRGLRKTVVVLAATLVFLATSAESCKDKVAPPPSPGQVPQPQADPEAPSPKGESPVEFRMILHLPERPVTVIVAIGGASKAHDVTDTTWSEQAVVPVGTHVSLRVREIRVGGERMYGFKQCDITANGHIRAYEHRNDMNDCFVEYTIQERDVP